MKARDVVAVAGWGLLVLFPLTGLVLAWTTISIARRVRIFEPGASLQLSFLDMTPSLLLILGGLAIGGVCLLLASIDRRLERLEGTK